MNRKLILLNAVLAALLIFAGWQWRTEYRAEKARESKIRVNTPPAPVPPLPALPQQPPVLATSYNDVAQKLLLHPSRNPDLPPPPVEVAPPPPPMPPLPKYHGSMNLDGEPVAILNEGNNPFEEVKIGGDIGQFKLVDVNTRDITFEWRGQQVRKTLSELLDRTSVDVASANNTGSSSASSIAPPPQVKSQVGPVGDESQFHTKACDPNDSYAPGSVVNGFRKVSRSTPFGPACVWEAVGR